MLKFEDALELILRAEKTAPAGSLWIESAHQLAELIVGAQQRLTAMEVATLIGIGAILARQGRHEFEAGIAGQNIWEKIRIERTDRGDQGE